MQTGATEKFRIIELHEEADDEKYYIIQRQCDDKSWEDICPPFDDEQDAIEYFNKIVNNEITEDGERIVAKNY